MRLNRTFVVLTILHCSVVLHALGQQSVLSSGNWYKMAVAKDGVYRINYSFLKKMGIDPSKIDPRKVRIYGNSGGMLPQLNSATRPIDLTENAIHIEGEADGKFDKNDFILFFATGADKVEYNVARAIHQYEKNLYADKNFYFLTIGADNGKRIATSQNLAGAYPIVSQFKDFVAHELDNHNELHSGREWYGEEFKSNGTTTFDFNISGVSNSAAIKMVSDVVGQTFSTAKFKLLINGVIIGEHTLFPIPSSQYGAKGIHDRDTLLVSGSTIAAEGKTNLSVQYQYENGAGSSKSRLDYFLLSFDRNLALYNAQTIFTCPTSLNNPISQFEIPGINDQTLIWDITNPAEILAQDFSTTNSTAIFSTTTAQLKKFIVFKESEAPGFIEKISNQNLRGLSTPNLIIVTHPTFVSEANRLAQHRSVYSGWTVAVVTTDQIFNEFSSGRQDVTAIRDFIKLLYNKNPGTLRAALMFGKASYDFKNRIENNTNLVPTYESRNSLFPLETYSSDDYFGFMENTEGQWFELPQQQNHTLDIGVGRLPVRSVEHARAIVDKIIQYDTDKRNLGYWRKQIALVADDGNGPDGFTKEHQHQANQLANFIESTVPAIDCKKLFMGIYRKTASPERCPDLTNDIIRAFELGSLIINFTGHGSERQWTDENVFNKSTIDELQNDRYPFLITATCEFGRHDDPREISGAEESVILENGGAIGLLTSTRPVNSTTNFNLNLAFYDAMLQKVNNEYVSLGDAFRLTKNNSMSGVANRNFALLADPSMTLALPSNEVRITELKTENGSDTVKALSKVIAKGEIRNANNEKLTDFNGVVEAVLFDKETGFATIGRNDPPYSFKEWNNALFRGRATVSSGEFQIEFMVSKNIAYQVAQGKFSLYASDPKTNRDAIGYYSGFKIGESEGMIADLIGPKIDLYMGDTTFINGGTIAPDSRVVARLEDNTGINISDYGLGNGLVAVLDGGTEQFALNDYYISDTDDYRSGWINFPIKDLEPGPHTLTLKAWDVNNNSSASTIEFIVSGEELRVETFGCYPNPFVDKSTLFFTHNRSGDELQAQVFIQKTTGEIVGSAEITVPVSGYRVDVLEIYPGSSGDKKLAPGLYLARLIVRSLTNGSKNEQVTKLIILN